ncbi:9981_t:CDS:2 [Paraglomus brasilianum]|uniref:9981_t:CDS:1 n=1 Tax=Paraglomus brasilianum TaxID=144538 RepID=A0A9N9FES6_9GLOM|nr:9981_t:CDS:2 [Paraglomus brasilianum]
MGKTNECITDDIDTSINKQQELAECTYSGEKRALPAGCLFVASLDATKSKEHLQQIVGKHFSQWGQLLCVKVLRDWANRPYSFVQYENVNDADVALKEAHGSWIENRRIRVEKARVNRTLFITRLHPNRVEEEIRSIFEPFGPLEEINVPKNFVTGRKKGGGFVKFCYRDDAINAFNTLRQTSNYFLEWVENLEKPLSEEEEEDRHSIYIGNLNEKLVTKKILYEKFDQHGKIEDLHLVNRGKKQRIPAYAFIKYSDVLSAEAAIIHEDNKPFLERQIKVQRRLTQEYRNFQLELNRQHNEMRWRSFGYYKNIQCPNLLTDQQSCSSIYAESVGIPPLMFYSPMPMFPPYFGEVSPTLPTLPTPPGSFMMTYVQQQ